MLTTLESRQKLGTFSGGTGFLCRYLDRETSSGNRDGKVASVRTDDTSIGAKVVKWVDHDFIRTFAVVCQKRI